MKLGVVMYNMRSSGEGSQEAISSILTLIWRIVASVNGIVFKDLKQTLRKEQCDVNLYHYYTQKYNRLSLIYINIFKACASSNGEFAKC